MRGHSPVQTRPGSFPKTVAESGVAQNGAGEADIVVRLTGFVGSVEGEAVLIYETDIDIRHVVHVIDPTDDTHLATIFVSATARYQRPDSG